MRVRARDGCRSCAAAPLEIEANLRTRQLITSTNIAAPDDGRAKGRIGWLLRQAKDMPPSLRVEARYPNAPEPTIARLNEALERPDLLVYARDPKRSPRAFRLVLAHDLGRGRGRGTFVGDSRKQLLEFYGDVLQRIRPWQPPAPRLPVAADVPQASEVLPVGVTVQPDPVDQRS